MNSSVAEKIFNILLGFGYTIKSYGADGKLEIDPQKATRFGIDNPNILVRLDTAANKISLETGPERSTHRVRKMLKNLSREYIMDFDYKVFDRNISPKGEAIDVAQHKDDVLGENFSPLTGSRRTSFQPLDSIKIIIKHKKPVNEEVRGSRSRNIHSIFIQNGEERFKMTENSLAAARAMARHISNGGKVHDTVGEGINFLAGEQRKLTDFVRYVNNKKMVNEENAEFVTIARENIQNIRETLRRLSGSKSYAVAVEALEGMTTAEVLNDDVDLESKFIETHYDDRVAAAIDSIKRAASLQTAFRTRIEEAIKAEDFSDLKSMLSEQDGVEFSTPPASLSNQVAQLAYAAQNSTLSTHLQNISKKIGAGHGLNQFEYGTIKSCLLGASEAKIKEGKNSIVEASAYERFINKYLI